VARATVFAVVASAALTLPHSVFATAPEERAVVNVLNATFEAEMRGDFVGIVSLMHPRTQQLFRDLLSARTDELLRTYPQYQISAVSGLAAHPKDLGLSDAEFFVLACNNTKARHPAFATDWTHIPFTLQATTFDPNQLAHVVLSWPDSVRTERTNFGFMGSLHVFLRYDQSQWRIWSCPFATRIGDLWLQDLATASWATPTRR
jgi:hypothetical protein